MTDKVQIGDATLYHGDCLEILPTLDKVDAVVTDPPYGTTQCKWDSVIPVQKMWDGLWGATKDSATIVLTCSQPFTSALISSNYEQFKYCWSWVKNLKTGNLNARRRPMVGHEDIAVFYWSQSTYNPQKRERTTEVRAGNKKNSKTTIYGKQREDYLDRQSDLICPDTVIIGIKCVHNSSGKVHPTQKPVALMEYLVKTYTNKGDTVLDFTMGSGTTGVACANLGRNFIGIEIGRKYFDIACERIEAAYAQERLFS
jgi:site-specific DNA-methyltransferase (adenine-specific)